MADFATEFPIKTDNNIEDVIRLACKWIKGSPHSKLKELDIQEIPADSERQYSFDGEHITIATAKASDFDIGGLQYIRSDHQLEWTTSIVALKTSNKHVLSLQVICEALNTAVRLPLPKKPYFIRQVLEELGGGVDGDFTITDKPLFLGEDEAQKAAQFILGAANNKLPIIYVSSGFQDNHIINPYNLAKFVSGMAHVVVEPNRSFSLKVKSLTYSRNVFGGTIGLYWPESNARSIYFINDITPDARSIEIEISKHILIAVSNRRLLTNCTWSYLKEIIAHKRYDQVKASGSTALQEYINAFDDDLAAKNNRLLELGKQITALNKEIQQLLNETKSLASGVLVEGKEQDFYNGEINDIVIDALHDSLRNMHPGSRRHHIITDLLASNKHCGARKKIEEEIKTIFKTYKDMDAKTRNSLTRLGFYISDEGKHFKAVYQGDGRYTIIFSKTSSDHRAGKNMISVISNVLF